MLILNTNKDTSVVSTEVLNRLSKSLRNSIWYRSKSSIKEGFEINYTCYPQWKWEYKITYNNSLLVFQENTGKLLDVWFYNDENDINPSTTFQIKLTNSHKVNSQKFNEFVEFVFN